MIHQEGWLLTIYNRLARVQYFDLQHDADLEDFTPMSLNLQRVTHVCPVLSLLKVILTQIHWDSFKAHKIGHPFWEYNSRFDTRPRGHLEWLWPGGLWLIFKFSLTSMVFQARRQRTACIHWSTQNQFIFQNLHSVAVSGHLWNAAKPPLLASHLVVWNAPCWAGRIWNAAIQATWRRYGSAVLAFLSICGCG